MIILCFASSINASSVGFGVQAIMPTSFLDVTLVYMLGASGLNTESCCLQLATFLGRTWLQVTYGITAHTMQNERERPMTHS